MSTSFVDPGPKMGFRGSRKITAPIFAAILSAMITLLNAEYTSLVISHHVDKTGSSCKRLVFVGRLKTRDLTSRDHQNCGDWHRETGQRGTISQGWTSRDLFQCLSRCSLQVYVYELLIGFMFVSIVLSVLLIATCGRLSWPALWTTFGRTIK